MESDSQYVVLGCDIHIDICGMWYISLAYFQSELLESEASVLSFISLSW